METSRNDCSVESRERACCELIGACTTIVRASFIDFTLYTLLKSGTNQAST